MTGKEDSPAVATKRTDEGAIGRLGTGPGNLPSLRKKVLGHPALGQSLRPASSRAAAPPRRSFLPPAGASPSRPSMASPPTTRPG